MSVDKNVNDLIWWLLSIDEIISEVLDLINKVNTVPTSDTPQVDTLLEKILEMFPRIRSIEEKLGVPFPYMKELINARLVLVLDKNSTNIE